MKISIPNIKPIDNLGNDTKRFLTYVGVFATAYFAFKLGQHFVRSLQISNLKQEFNIGK